MKEQHIQIIREKYPDYFHELLNTHTYPLNKNQPDKRTVIDWDQIENKRVQPYFYKGSEKEITEFLSNSPLNNDLELIIESGYNEPMIKTTGRYFVNNWYDLILENGDMGTCIISGDGKYIIEFTDDTSWLLYTNF